MALITSDCAPCFACSIHGAFDDKKVVGLMRSLNRKVFEGKEFENLEEWNQDVRSATFPRCPLAACPSVALSCAPFRCSHRCCDRRTS